MDDIEQRPDLSTGDYIILTENRIFHCEDGTSQEYLAGTGAHVVKGGVYVDLMFEDGRLALGCSRGKMRKVKIDMPDDAQVWGSR